MPFDGKDVVQQADVLDALRRGQERVAQGWCQHMLWTGVCERAPRFCVYGSLLHEREKNKSNAALYERESDKCDAAMVVLYRVLPPEWQTAGRWGSELECVVSYNNAPDRTQADIVALFERAITVWEKNNALR